MYIYKYVFNYIYMYTHICTHIYIWGCLKSDDLDDVGGTPPILGNLHTCISLVGYHHVFLMNIWGVGSNPSLLPNFGDVNTLHCSDSNDAAAAELLGVCHRGLQQPFGCDFLAEVRRGFTMFHHVSPKMVGKSANVNMEIYCIYGRICVLQSRYSTYSTLKEMNN